MEPNCKTRISAEMFARIIGIPREWKITDVEFDFYQGVFHLGINRPDWEQDVTPLPLQEASPLFRTEDGRIKSVTWRHKSGDVEVEYTGIR